MNRSVILSSVVIKNSSNTFNAAPIPAGKRLVITRVGLTDESKGDKPSIARIRFGGELIRVLCETTGTTDIPVNKEFQGDGVKFLSVERENAENSDKPITVWIEAYDT